MLETTTVISYKHPSGSYKMAEVFIYKSPIKTIRLIQVNSDGFLDPIEMPHISKEFNDYIKTMFGYQRYILMFNQT